MAKKKATKKKAAKKKATKKKATKKKATKKKATKKKATKKKAAKKKAAKKKAAKKKATKKKTAKKKTAKSDFDEKGVTASVEFVQLPEDEAYRIAEMAYLKYRDHLLGLSSDILEVSLGVCFRDNQPTGEFGLRLHVGSHEAKTKLRNDAFEGRIDLKPAYGGVRVDIMVWNLKPMAAQYIGQAFSCAGVTPRDRRVLGPRQRGTIGATAISLNLVTNQWDLHWMTAGHVVAPKILDSQFLPQSSVIGYRAKSNFFGSTISRVSLVNQFTTLRDELCDASLIRFGSRDNFPSMDIWKRIPVADVERFKNQRAYYLSNRGDGLQPRDGRITSVNVPRVPIRVKVGNGIQVEIAIQHFELFGAGTIGGDSGALVISYDRFSGARFAVGIVRAANTSEPGQPTLPDITYCSKITFARAYFRNRHREFDLRFMS